MRFRALPIILALILSLLIIVGILYNQSQNDKPNGVQTTAAASTSMPSAQAWWIRL